MASRVGSDWQTAITWGNTRFIGGDPCPFWNFDLLGDFVPDKSVFHKIELASGGVRQHHLSDYCSEYSQHVEPSYPFYHPTNLDRRWIWALAS